MAGGGEKGLDVDGAGGDNLVGGFMGQEITFGGGCGEVNGIIDGLWGEGSWRPRGRLRGMDCGRGRPPSDLVPDSGPRSAGTMERIDVDKGRGRGAFGERLLIKAGNRP